MRINNPNLFCTCTDSSSPLMICTKSAGKFKESKLTELTKSTQNPPPQLALQSSSGTPFPTSPALLKDRGQSTIVGGQLRRKLAGETKADVNVQNSLRGFRVEERTKPTHWVQKQTAPRFLIGCSQHHCRCPRFQRSNAQITKGNRRFILLLALCTTKQATAAVLLLGEVSPLMP